MADDTHLDRKPRALECEDTALSSSRLPVPRTSPNPWKGVGNSKPLTVTPQGSEAHDTQTATLRSQHRRYTSTGFQRAGPVVPACLGGAAS